MDESAPLPLDNNSSDLNGLSTSVLPIVAVAFYKYCTEYVDKCTTYMYLYVVSGVSLLFG